MAEAIVFQIDVTTLTTALVGLGKELDVEKKKLDDLKESNKEGSEEFVRQQAVVNALAKERRAMTNALEKNALAEKQVTAQTKQNIEANKASQNSIDQNRKAYNALYNQYIRADEATRKRLLPAIQAVDKALKEQEKTIGDTRRNVGNYAEGFKDAANELNIFGVGLGSVKKGLDGAKSGFQAAGGGVKGFALALATTGLPLIIAGINLLINAFQSFKPVADAVEDSVTALKAAFGALISGGSIKQAVSDSLELLNTLRDLEDTQNAFNISVQRQRNEIEKLIIQSKDRTKTEKERTALLEDAEKREKELFNTSVERLDREIAAEEKAFANKLKLSKGQLKLLEEGTSEAALALRTRLEKDKQYSEDELNTLQKKIKERAALEGQTNKDLEKIVNSRNKLVEKEEEAREKAAAAAKARREKERAELEKYNQNLIKLLDEFTLSEREKLAQSFDAKSNQIKGNNAQELALIETINTAKEAALTKFDNEADAKRQAQFDKNRADIIAGETGLINEKITLNQTLLENELAAVDLSVLSEEDKVKRKKQIQLEYLGNQLALVTQLASADNILTEQELANIKKLELAIKGLKEVTAEPTPKISEVLGIDEKELGNAAAALGGFQQLVGSLSQTFSAINEQRISDIESQYNTEIDNVNRSALNKEDKEKKIRELERQKAKEKYEQELSAFNTSKALQIVNATIATALAVIQGLQTGFSIPIVGVGLGPALAAAAGVAGAVQIGIIAAQKPPAPPAFADGGKVLSGQMIGESDGVPISRSNGDNRLATVKTGEVVLNTMQQNALGGAETFRKIGVPGFAGGGYIPTGDGGYASRYAGTQQSNNIAMSDVVKEAVRNIPNPIVTVEEINRVNTSSDRSVAVSEL